MQHQQKNSLHMTPAQMGLGFTALALIAGLIFIGCSKKEESSAQSAPPMSDMPVSVIELQPTSVPISAEAVAQTEGAKEVEIRPRVGGILLKKLFEEGAPIKAGQVMFLIDQVPFQIALANAKAQLAQQQARVEQTPVSYTHLDVYKRQVWMWLCNACYLSIHAPGCRLG